METRPPDIDAADPRGLIRESYRIEGIGEGECRAIFLDWALNVPAQDDTLRLIRRLLGYHGQIAPDHPMTETLKAALAAPPKAERRGGRKGRLTGPEDKTS